jgi:hypothetical protein
MASFQPWSGFDPSGPRTGVSEDILFCIDLNKEMEEPWGENLSNSSRLQVLQKALSFFVRHKSTFSRNHRFGICTITDSVTQVLDFTNDTELVSSMINSLTPGWFALPYLQCHVVLFMMSCVFCFLTVECNMVFDFSHLFNGLSEVRCAFVLMI